VYVGVGIEIEKTGAARSAGQSCSSLLLGWKKPCCGVRHSSAPGNDSLVPKTIFRGRSERTWCSEISEVYMKSRLCLVYVVRVAGGCGMGIVGCGGLSEA